VMAEPTYNDERLNVYRLPIEYFAFSHQIAKPLGGTQHGTQLERVPMIKFNFHHPNANQPRIWESPNASLCSFLVRSKYTAERKDNRNIRFTNKGRQHSERAI
jgi:hypothetical protein